jgi:K+-transporting ATPase ATPase C chain
VFTSVLRQLWPAFRAMLVMTVLVGLAYPLALTGFAQVAVQHKADGSLVERDGKVVGSSLIGQSFDGKSQYFQSRPSAAGDGYDPLASSASNLGPESPDLLQAIKERRAAAAALDGTTPADVAPDALEASGSGLDPHISPAYADQQVARVARERGVSPSEVRKLVEKYTDGRTFGFLGEPHVNVLLLNLALDRASAGSRGTAD